MAFEIRDACIQVFSAIKCIIYTMLCSVFRWADGVWDVNGKCKVSDHALSRIRERGGGVELTSNDILFDKHAAKCYLYCSAIVRCLGISGIVCAENYQVSMKDGPR